MNMSFAPELWANAPEERRAKIRRPKIRKSPAGWTGNHDRTALSAQSVDRRQ